jgi:hypothetical protein
MNDHKNDQTNEDMDIGEDLEITKTTRRAAGAGTWVCGRLNGHRFEALVFPEHAESETYELGDSRGQPGDSQISKLWVGRLKDNATVFNWDRGLDVPAADNAAARVIDFLCAGLAESTYGA